MDLVNTTYTVLVYDDLLTRRSLRRCRVIVPRPAADAPPTLLRDVLGLAGVGPGSVVLVNGRVLGVDDAAYQQAIDPSAEIIAAPGRPGDPVSIVLAVIAVASALASSLLAPKIAGLPVTSEDPEQRRFGFGRFSQDALAGDAVPVVFGRHVRYGGKTVSRVSGDGPDGDARARILIALSDCRIESIGSRVCGDSPGGHDRLAHDAISGIWINDQPISAFPGAKVSLRFGTSDQRSIPGFDDTEVPRDVGGGGVDLVNTSGAVRTSGTPSGEAYTFTSFDPVDSVALRIELPQGLYVVSRNNQLNSWSVSYRVRTRTLGSGSGGWSAWEVFTLERADRQGVVSVNRITLPEPQRGTRVDVQVERVSAEPADLTAVDLLRLTQVIEITDSDNRFPGVALLALELIAGENLTSAPKVSVTIRGCNTLRLHDGVSPASAPVFTVGYSDTPADIALALLTDEVIGLGGEYSDADIDFASLLEWREDCRLLIPRQAGSGGGGTRRKHQCSIVMGERRDAIDWLRTVCNTGDCTPVPAGRVWRFIADRARPEAVERFGEGEIAVDDSGVAIFEYTREFARGAVGVTRPNQLTCQYENAARQGRPDTFTFPELGELWLADEPLRERAFRLDGVVDTDQIADRVILELKKLRGLTRTIQFTTTKQAVVVQPGERFDFAMTLVGWSAGSGRIEAYPAPSAESVTLSTPVDIGNIEDAVIEVQFADGTVEVRRIEAASTLTGGRMSVRVTPAFSHAPGVLDSYSIGRPGLVTKPFTCTMVRPVEDKGRLVWELGGIEYDAQVYDREAVDITLPDYSDLRTPATPPGPVASISANERVVGSLRTVDIGVTQRPADREITAYFIFYRRLQGARVWIETPALTPSLRGAVIELLDLDVAYDFIAVAVSAFGAKLSPNDPRHPVAGVVYGLPDAFPPPPASVSVENTGGNTVALSWSAVDGATGYQVLTGGASTSLPAGGAEDCLVLARTIGAASTRLEGLEMPPGRAVRFWVRTVGAGDRMSRLGTTLLVAAQPAPAGESIRLDQDFDLATDGTRTNCSFVTSPAWPFAAADRLRITDATDADGGVFESDAIDVGAAAMTELTIDAGTANDAEDPEIQEFVFPFPGVEADQWGVVDASTDPVVGMLMPPFPDARQAWTFEVRTSVDGSTWTDYQAFAPLTSVRRMLRYYRVRATMKRGDSGGGVASAFPYRPALRSLAVVATS